MSRCLSLFCAFLGVWMLLGVSPGNANLCRIPLKGSCQCVTYEQENPPYSDALSVECTRTSPTNLHHDIDRIYNHFNRTRPIQMLQVRDSNLVGLPGLPSGLDNVRHLIVDNTGVDLEQIRESNELLDGLRSFRIYNENFTEIPENYFQGFHELNILELNDVGIAAISEDGFHYLEDSLKELGLRENKLRRIPIAIASLSHLETLDLQDNEIPNVADDLTQTLERGLKSLNKLIMNRINCTCEFGKTDFVAWIRSYAIKGVTCHEPRRLNGRDVSTTPMEDFCGASSSSRRKLSEWPITSSVLLITITFLISALRNYQVLN